MAAKIFDRAIALREVVGCCQARKHAQACTKRDFGWDRDHGVLIALFCVHRRNEATKLRTELNITTLGRPSLFIAC